MSALGSATVVVPTRKRPDGLRAALGALALQADPGVPWNVVIVDNDALPGTVAAEVEPEVAALKRAGVGVEVVVEPRLGATNARNRGIAEADGDVVAFLDDDVVPDCDWLDRLLRPVLAGECDAVGGRVDLDPAVATPAWMPDWFLPYLAQYAPADERIALDDLPRGALSEPYLLTANAAFTADVLDRCGGFDPDLGPRDGVPFVNDDLDLCRRVRNVGGRIIYDPAPRVVHELPASRLTRRFMLRRLHAQGRSDWILDREMFGARKTGGVYAAIRRFALDTRQAFRDPRLAPAHRFVIGSAARRSGLLREALVHLVRRREQR